MLDDLLQPTEQNDIEELFEAILMLPRHVLVLLEDVLRFLSSVPVPTVEGHSSPFPKQCTVNKFMSNDSMSSDLKLTLISALSV